MDAIPIISLFLLESIWFTIYYYLSIFLYMFKIFELTEQYMYVQVTYRNQMFCTYLLHKRHEQFFGAQSQISSFGPKLDRVSEPYMTVLILLPCSVVLFIRLQLLSFWGNISVNISGAMFFLL